MPLFSRLFFLEIEPWKILLLPRLVEINVKKLSFNIFRKVLPEQSLHGTIDYYGGLVVEAISTGWYTLKTTKTDYSGSSTSVNTSLDKP